MITKPLKPGDYIWVGTKDNTTLAVVLRARTLPNGSSGWECRSGSLNWIIYADITKLSRTLRLGTAVEAMAERLAGRF